MVCHDATPWRCDAHATCGDAMQHILSCLVCSGLDLSYLPGPSPGDAIRMRPGAMLCKCDLRRWDATHFVLSLSCLILPCLALSCLVWLSCLALSCLALSCLGLSCLVMSCLVLCCPVLSHPVKLSCFVLSAPVSSNLVLLCLVLSCFDGLQGATQAMPLKYRPAIVRESARKRVSQSLSSL